MTNREKYLINLKLKNHYFNIHDLYKESICFCNSNEYSVYCGICGHYQHLHGVVNIPGKDHIICKNCGVKLDRSWSLINPKRRLKKEYINFQKLEIIDNIQVVRIYEGHFEFRKKEKCKIFLDEVMRIFIDEKFRFTFFAKKINYNYYCNTWRFDTGFSLCKYEKYLKMINLTPRKLGYNKVLPIFKKFGYINCNIGLVEYLKKLNEFPLIETFAKLKEQYLLEYCFYGNDLLLLERYKKQIFLALKWKYKFPSLKFIKDYLDYIEMCETLNYDIRNKKYVCPSCLELAHDKLYDLINKNKDDSILKREIILYDDLYKHKIEKFLDVDLSDINYISIKIIPSIEDIYLEGKLLHHCVFTNKYYKNKNSLLFSCKVNGKNIETCEIAFDTLNILQCRGDHNLNSDYHDEFIRLINKNKYLLNLIK